MIILITGTPGTGKTSITSILSDKTKCKPVNLSKLVLDEELAVPDPSGRETLVLDNVEYLVKQLDRLLEKEKCLIIDTHYPSIIQPLASKLELVVVLRTQPQILYERLTRRKWSPRKVVENVEAEFIGIVRSEVDELNLGKGKLLVIDTSKLDSDEAASLVLKCLENPRECGEAGISEVDWTIHEPSVRFVLSLISSIDSNQNG